MKRPDYKGHTIETVCFRARGTQVPEWAAVIDGVILQGARWEQEPIAWAGAQVEIRRREKQAAEVAALDRKIAKRREQIGWIIERGGYDVGFIPDEEQPKGES